jgi:hypothetical protein
LELEHHENRYGTAADRRRVETRPGSTAEDVTYPPYVTRNRENTRVTASLPAGTGNPTPENVPGETEVTEDIYEE